MDNVILRVDNKFFSEGYSGEWITRLDVEQVVVFNATETNRQTYKTAAIDCELLFSCVDDLSFIVAEEKRTLLIVDNISDLESIFLSGLRFTQVTIGNLPKKDNAKRFSSHLYISDNDESIMKALNAKGVTFLAQHKSDDNAVSLPLGRVFRFGIIGTGPISKRFMANANGIYGFKLNAVYSRNLETAKKFSKEYDVEHAFDNLNEFVNYQEMDAVYIGSPNSLHCFQTLAALRAGKHVLCEKPFASNIKETQTMLDLAAEKRLALLEVLRPIFSDAYIKVKEILPLIGEIRYVSFTYHQYSSRYDNFKKGIIENAFDPTLSNAAIMDLGCYCTHWLIGLFGLPKKVVSCAIKLENGFEGQGTYLAEYEGMIVQVSYSKISQSYAPSVIEGEKGSILIDHLTLTRKITLKRLNGDDVTWDFDDYEFNMAKAIEALIAFANDLGGLEIYSNYTTQVMTILDMVREQQSIVFPADI